MMRRARAAALAGVLLSGCEGSAPEVPVVAVEPARPRVRPTTSGTANEVAPHEPVTVAKLVADGRYWRIQTKNGPVHVWTPKGYRRKRAETVVYVHGFFTHVDAAWSKHHLPAQFAASAINAMFIACEAPANGSEPVSWTSVSELLAAVEAGIGKRVPRRRLVAVGHSGAWRTLLHWLDEPLLDTVVLFDAVYGELEKYKSWVLASPRRRLIDVGDDTKKWADQLHADLDGSVILEGFPPADQPVPPALRRAQIVYIRSNVGHIPLVTGGVALPLTLRMLRAKQLLDMPLAELLEAGQSDDDDDD